MTNKALQNWLTSPQRAQSEAINNLATIDECLLASCNAVACGDRPAASAINNHARGVIGSDGSAMEETVLEVIYANIRLADVVHAAQEAVGSLSALPLLNVGYGTVITRQPTVCPADMHEMTPAELESTLGHDWLRLIAEYKGAHELSNGNWRWSVKL